MLTFKSSADLFTHACLCESIRTVACKFASLVEGDKPLKEELQVSVKSGLGRSAAFPKPTQNTFSAYGLPRAVQREVFTFHLGCS